MGALVGFAALLGPYFLLEPLFVAILPHLPVSINIKIALATSLVMMVAVLVIIAALAAYGKSVRDIGVGKPKVLYAAHALVAFFAYFVITLTVQVVASAFFGLNAEEPQELGYTTPGGAEVFAALIPLVFITPFAEELIFRGFIFTGFRRHLPFWVAAVGVSALFGLVHGQWNVGLDVFVMSLVSCYLVEKTGSLWPSIFLHVFKNGVAFCLLYLYNGG